MFGKGTGNPLEHRFDIIDVGKNTKKGTIVNDRFLIGKKSAKIVELKLFENRSQFLGFEATYLVGNVEIKGLINVLKK